MKRMVLILPLTLAVYTGAFAQQAVTIDTAIRQAGGYIIENLPRNSRVVILNIESDKSKISIHI